MEWENNEEMRAMNNGNNEELLATITGMPAEVCREALEQAGGDMEQAGDMLVAAQRQGSAAAAAPAPAAAASKPTSREAPSGHVAFGGPDLTAAEAKKAEGNAMFKKGDADHLAYYSSANRSYTAAADAIKGAFVWPAAEKLLLVLWTILQHDGPDHLGLWYNALPEHQMALIASGCGCPSGAACEPGHGRPEDEAARCGPPQHGLSSKKMTLITSDCGATRSPIINWP